MISNKTVIIGAVLVIILVILAYFAGRIAPSSQPQNAQVSTSTAAVATTTASTSTQAAPVSVAPVVTHGAPAATSQAPTTPAGTHTLHVGQVVAVAPGDTITVVSVADNRCPIGVVCTEAGTVSADIKLQVGTYVQSQILTLGLPTTEYGFTAELVSASPEKVKGEAIPQSAYSLVFTIK